MLGRLLCLLGLHQPVVTVPGTSIDDFHTAMTYRKWATSAIGYCARCDKPYQWDHTAGK